MVRRVELSSSAAEAGIQPGDAIVAIDGKSVLGSNSHEMSKRLEGEVGSSVEVSIIQANDTQRKVV